MVDRAETARVAIDPHVVRWVAEDHRGMLLAHQCGKGRGMEGTAAQQTMVIERPCGADLADRRSGRQVRQDVGRGVVWFPHSVERRDPQIYLAHLKAGPPVAETKIKQGAVCKL